MRANVLTELSFRVAGEDNLVCAFTRMNPGARVVINPLRATPSARVERATYTVDAPVEKAWALIDAHFEGEGDSVEVVVEREESLTVEVPFRLPRIGNRDDPLHMALETLGEDAFFLPLVVEEGYIHCTLVSASSEGTRTFIELTRRINDHLQPDAFHVLHVGPWKPRPSVPERHGLTERQRDVLQLAVALGYYEQPRGTTLEALGELLGVSKAAVHKTLTAAENKVLKDAAGAR